MMRIKTCLIQTYSLSLDCLFWNFSNIQKSWKNDTWNTYSQFTHLTIYQLLMFCYICTTSALFIHSGWFVWGFFFPSTIWKLTTYFSLKHWIEPMFLTTMPLLQKKHSVTTWHQTIWIHSSKICNGSPPPTEI